MTNTRPFDAPEGLDELRQIVESLDPAGPPAASLVALPSVGRARLDLRQLRRLGFLAGSFNPLHDAHVALAHRGLAVAGLDAVFFVLSKRTLDKERVTGLGLDERLYLLRQHCATHDRLGTLFVNRGLYVDHARIAHATFPALHDLCFLVGYDKVLQIFDPRYYDDRDAALAELFALARFLVAPRDRSGHGDLHQLLAHPENQRFADRVEPVELDPSLRDVSSSDVRAAIAHGTLDDLPIPELVRKYIEATRAYQRDTRG